MFEQLITNGRSSARDMDVNNRVIFTIGPLSGADTVTTDLSIPYSRYIVVHRSDLAAYSPTLREGAHASWFSEARWRNLSLGIEASRCRLDPTA